MRPKIKSPYLLTSIKGIPIIIKCESHKDIDKFSTKGSFMIGKGVAERNIKSGRWINENIDEYIAQMITDEIGTDYDCWIQLEDSTIIQ